jgi:hypothetical protein
MRAEIAAGGYPQLPREFFECRWNSAIVGHAFGRHNDAVRAVAKRHHAEAQLRLADFGHHGGQCFQRRG